MKKILLLIVFPCFLAVIFLAGCNDAQLDDPTSNPLPGSGTESPSIYDDVDANYALDIINPNREPPPSIPIEDPKWEPVFNSFTDKMTCIDEGCMSFELKDFDPDTQIATFKGTFFNFNADKSDELSIFLLFTDLANGIVPVTPDGMMKLDKFDTVAYTFIAFNHDENEKLNIPESMYLYFEREFSFHLEYGSDFYVGISLLPFKDVHNLSHYTIDEYTATKDDHEGSTGDDGRTGDSTGDSSGVPGGAASGGSTPVFGRPGINEIRG